MKLFKEPLDPKNKYQLYMGITAFTVICAISLLYMVKQVAHKNIPAYFVEPQHVYTLSLNAKLVSIEKINGVFYFITSFGGAMGNTISIQELDPKNNNSYEIFQYQCGNFEVVSGQYLFHSKQWLIIIKRSENSYFSYQAIIFNEKGKMINCFDMGIQKFPPKLLWERENEVSFFTSNTKELSPYQIRKYSMQGTIKQNIEWAYGRIRKFYPIEKGCIVLLQSNSYMLSYMDKSGEILWSLDFGKEEVTNCVLEDNKCYLDSINNYKGWTYCIDLNTGKIISKINHLNLANQKKSVVYRGIVKLDEMLVHYGGIITKNGGFAGLFFSDTKTLSEQFMVLSSKAFYPNAEAKNIFVQEGDRIVLFIEEKNKDCVQIYQMEIDDFPQTSQPIYIQ